MTSRERVLSCLDRNGYDRIPIYHHMGTPEFHQKLCRRTGLDIKVVLPAVGHDFGWIGPIYRGPELKKYPDGSYEGLWGEIYSPSPYGHGENAGTYGEARHLPFAGVEDVSELKDTRWPSADWYDYSSIREQCLRARSEGKTVEYAPWSFDFINNTARTRGVEQVMLDIGLRHPVFIELVRKRFEFNIEKDRRVFDMADGLIDVYHACEDLGGQSGPLISPTCFDELFAPFYAEAFALAHQHGARTKMHVCGGVRPLIPRLIELGLDILDVVQVSATGMDIEGLARDFGQRLSFCGSMCVQTILANGTVDSVRKEVDKRLSLFPKGGLILGPSHDIQVHTPVENVLAMYASAGSLDPVVLRNADHDLVTALRGESL